MPTLAYVGTKLALSAVQPVMSKVGSLIEKEIDCFWDVDKKLKELKVAYRKTQARLSKLDSLHMYDTTLEGFLPDLSRYCYDIEDIVDYLNISFQTKEEDRHGIRSFIIQSFKIKIPRKIGELQKNLEGLDSLIVELLSAGAINIVQSQNGEKAYSKSLYDKTPLVDGTRRDRDKQKVISKLISPQSKHYGVSIIGMDGLGKTSLARTILLDESIAEYFDLVLSACVSDHFQLTDVVQKLVRNHSPLTLEQIVDSKKTLIILDDIWSVTKEDWDLFRFNNLTSCPDWRILTTTRNPKVAKVTKSNMFYLDRMTEKDCEKIIVERAELSELECEHLSNDIQVIAKKCMGIPIIAEKVGLNLSILKSGAERKESIKQFTKAQDLEEFTEVIRSLNLDEPKLPSNLKKWFAYCSLFPAGHEFNKDNLIQLWEVEGHTQSPQSERFVQEMKHRFEDLLSRSILQPFKSKDKKQTVYKMHEFNHEFAHLLASKAICRIEEGTTNSFSSSRILRHLSLACHNTDKTLLMKIGECKRLRTFLLLHHSHPRKRAISENFFRKLKRLRLLDLSHTNISNLSNPKSLSKRLRFLDLSYSSIKKLPRSVCTIPALRILKLKGCKKLIEVAKEFRYLTNLTHLHMDMKDLERPPSKIGGLTKLEVLDSFSVTEDDSCRPLELQGMKNLKEIHMFGLENIRNMKEAQESMLSEKNLLKILVLEWTSNTVENASDVLKGLEPHSHLDNLVLRNYAGENFPEWLVSPSCQITSFKMENCPNCEGLPSLSQLPFLTNLVFHSIDKVKTLDDQFCQEGERCYPCLELLEFHDMKTLEKWSGLNSGNMHLLSSLKMVNCPMLTDLPSFKPLGCLINLEINACPALHSLPELPSSMNTDSGELVIIYSTLVASRCQPEGADWPKIKDIPYVEIDATKVMTRSSTPYQENLKGTVDESRINQSKGKQKVDEGSSPNQVQVAYTPPQNETTEQSELHHRPDEGSSSNQVQVAYTLPQNEIKEQPEDMEPTNETQLTSPSLQSTSRATAELIQAPSMEGLEKALLECYVSAPCPICIPDRGGVATGSDPPVQCGAIQLTSNTSQSVSGTALSPRTGGPIVGSKRKWEFVKAIFLPKRSKKLDPIAISSDVSSTMIVANVGSQIRAQP